MSGIWELCAESWQRSAMESLGQEENPCLVPAIDTASTDWAVNTEDCVVAQCFRKEPASIVKWR